MANESRGERGDFVPGGAKGVRRDKVGEKASAVTSAHTRTMTTEGTTSFSPVDYVKPQDGGRDDADGRARVVDRATMRRLGRSASGVSSLRDTVRAKGGREKAPAAPANMRAVVIVIVVVALLVTVGAFFLFRNALSSMNDAAVTQSSAVYATDAYVVLAVTDDDGGLADAYVAYVDSIGDRTELMELSPTTADKTQAAQGDAGVPDGARTLAAVWSDGGAGALGETIADLGGVDVKLTLTVTSAQMAQILDLAANPGSSTDLTALATEIAQANEGEQGATASAVHGMLVTIRDIGPDGYLMHDEPADDVNVGSEPMKVLRDQEWRTELRGMRNTGEDVSE
ncbi:hypothetical protein I3I95_05485 [bacterium]|nr:hypothetical protein [bacterium]